MTASRRARPRLIRLTAARISPPTRRSMLRGLIVYRWLTVVWAGGVFTWQVFDRRMSAAQADVAHPVVGFCLLGAAIGLTAWLTRLYRIDPDRLVKPPPVLAEIGIGTIMLLADAWVYGSPDHLQSVPSIWVVAAVTAVAVAGGRRAAVTTGLGMGFARYVGLMPYGGPQANFEGLSTMILMAVSGWVAGYLLHRLSETDRLIASARAREEVTRTLHDGVLQTLAVIQRRSDDDELVTLARSQERELRDYLFGADAPAADLASGLRAAAGRAEQRYDLQVDVVLAPDLPAGRRPVVRAVAAAVGEALTNAAKHGSAHRATVYAEPAPDSEIFVSVKDDGRGFDPATTPEGEGLRRSVRARLAEAGGRVEIDGRPGRGAEIRMWV